METQRCRFLTQRRFIDLRDSLLDPDYWRKTWFISAFFEKVLPRYMDSNPLYKGKYYVVDVEPAEAKYAMYVKAQENDWYLEDYTVVGEDATAINSDRKDRIKTAVEVAGGRLKFSNWRPNARWSLAAQSTDLAFLCEGALARLGRDRLKAALRELRRILKKKTGRLVMLLTPEDEDVLSGDINNGYRGTVLDKSGFKLVKAERADCGLVGCYAKVGNVDASLKSAKKRKRPRRKGRGVNG